MSDLHIEIKDVDSAERGWKGLTPVEEREVLYDLLSAIRSAANDPGDALDRNPPANTTR